MNRTPVILGGLMLCAPAWAQIQTPMPAFIEERKPARELYVRVPSMPDARTPREEILNTKLAMPGVGLAASKEALQRRMMYAAENGWLSQSQLDELTNDLKTVGDKETALRDAEGALNAREKQSLAGEIYKLNEKFEDFVLSRELNAPGKDGLLAREMFLKQKVQQAINTGKLSRKQAVGLKGELAELADEIDAPAMDTEKMKEISGKLTDLGNEINKRTQTGLAVRGPFSIK